MFLGKYISSYRIYLDGKGLNILILNNFPVLISENFYIQYNKVLE